MNINKKKEILHILDMLQHCQCQIIARIISQRTNDTRILINHFQFIISEVINQDRINMQDVQHQSK